MSTFKALHIGARLRHLPRGLAALSLGACLLAAVLAPAPAQAEPNTEHPFEIVPGSFHVIPSTHQAGAHQDLTTTLDFAHAGSGLGAKTYNDVKTTSVELPAGFLGNNTAVPTCTDAQLIGKNAGQPECSPASQVGTISVDLTINHASVRSTFGLYNMEVTSPGIAAQLGFNAVVINQILDVTVRPGDSGLTITSPSIQETGEPHEVSVTVWGVPAEHRHDPERGRSCYEQGTAGVAECKGGGEEVGTAPRPYLSNPTSCSEAPLVATVRSNSWEEPEHWSEESTEIAPIVECERVHFDPSVKATPTTDAAESPTGLDFSMEVPQNWENPETIVTSNLDDASVTLPEGMSLNPSAGSGLGDCTEAQLARETFSSLPGEGCPPESKVGSVEVETPLLTEHATGAVYVAKPFENPFDSLLALYVVAKIPSRGIIVKVAGKVTPNPVTGQLVTSFEENPQVPFNKFTLSFRQGATSPLVSPPVCGKYAAEADLTPWSAPLEPRHLAGEFAVETGINGAPCPSGGVPPFHPGLVAGTVNNAAGTYSPFYLRLSRSDGEQEITRFQIKLPSGVIGKLAGVSECSDAQIAQAKSREHEQGGAEEEAHPSCPASSEVGHTLVEAGVGSVLAQAPGHVYLAGPYHGSPLSLVSITAAKVGPFDLGTVVVRFALDVDHETAEVSVDGVGSDPIPHIIDGIPVHLRNIRTYVDRPNFTLNPTSCKSKSTASTVLGSGKDFTSSADDVPVTVSSPFQAADCASLGFAPKLALSLVGRKTGRGALPAFRAVLTYPRQGAYANIAKAQVTLPGSEFLEQGHLKNVCTRKVFETGTNPGENCPADSIYGHARAITPLLGAPLEGPVYLRTGYGTRLPELAAALNGPQISITLAGTIDSVHQKGTEGSRIRNTFAVVPDAPVEKFTLELEGGKKGLLVNSVDVCKGTHKALAAFTGQNGRLDEYEPPLRAQCGRGGGKKGAKKKGVGGR